VNSNPLRFIDPTGLNSQYSINLGGSLGFLLVGTNINVAVGLSVPTSPGDIGDYQLFITPQASAMVGAGLYIGGGLGYNAAFNTDQLPTFSYGSSIYLEGDIGLGPSIGINGQIGLSDLNQCTGHGPSGAFGFSLPVSSRFGAGAGLWIGGGPSGSFTLATPPLRTIGQTILDQLAPPAY